MRFRSVEMDVKLYSICRRLFLRRYGSYACMRSAPIADINYIDALTIGASDVRDDVPLLH